ncbi:DUF3265 domain-containing protein [Vibrio vulnificus]|nr:DUF3265 domain-containing protein [Vibrio vulnificus]MBF4499447.1 DUF3265 domain-containing protein [Vibrio vulnificus]MBL6179018.1 DUF3265 domain-containing protein [Vibrio vulnificus]HDY7983729.1 DUF3265 domain-containing protein [Vibrio vulnificus]HDY8007255.1 DUF3265 domain-containing protein [Vibrio vulnificus]
MTRRLSGIHAAWHFWYAVSFSGESGLQKAGLSGIHPLTQRYSYSICDCIEFLFMVELTLLFSVTR